MIYGGTIRPGSCEGQPQLDIVSAFQSYGKFLQDGQTEDAEKFRYNTVRHACPGPGACGGVGTTLRSNEQLLPNLDYLLHWFRCTQRTRWLVLPKP